MSPSASILHFLKKRKEGRPRLIVQGRKEKRLDADVSVWAMQCLWNDAEFKRNIQEKALELTADFMVNWIRFETSVYTIHPGLFLRSYTHTFHQCVPNSLSTSLSFLFLLRLLSENVY